MVPNWSLWFCCLTAWTSVSMSNSQSVCQKPANVVPMTGHTLQGVWSHQMNAADSGNIQFNKQCDKEEYIFYDLTTALGVNSNFDLIDGQFKVALSDVSIRLNDYVLYQPRGSPNVKIFMYVILWKTNELVGSVCYYDDAVFIQQYAVVMTRAQTLTQARALDLLTEAGVTYKQFYFYKNYPECRGTPCAAN